MVRLRSARVAATVATVALALAACGAADGGADRAAVADDPTARATAQVAEVADGRSDDATPDAPSRRPGGDGADVLTAALRASEELPTARTRLVATTVTPGGSSVAVTAEGVHRGADAALRITFGGAGLAVSDGEDVAVDVVLVDGVVYQRFPLLTAELGTDAEWLALELDLLGPAFADVLDAIESADPADAMSLFERAGEVRTVGEEEIDGTATTHLVVAVPLRDVAAAKGLEDHALGGRGADLDEVVEYDVWIDERSRVRRIAGDVDVAGLSVSSAVDVLEYDVDVDIQPPPPELTVRFDELMGAASDGVGSSSEPP